MNYSLLLSIFLTVAAGVVRAEVPNVFTAGTTARASEVNENFQVLDGDVQELKERTSILEEGVARGECNTQGLTIPFHTFSYTPKASTVGESITISDQTFWIVEMPIVEFGTGDIYKLKIPVKELNKNNPGAIYQTVSTSHTTSDTHCSNVEIAGYPAMSYGLGEGRAYYLRHQTSDSYLTESRLSYSVTIQIKINETTINLYPYISIKETESAVAVGDYNFMDDYDTSVMEHRADLMRSADDLIDYIEIAKVE